MPNPFRSPESIAHSQAVKASASGLLDRLTPVVQQLDGQRPEIGLRTLDHNYALAQALVTIKLPETATLAALPQPIQTLVKTAAVDLAGGATVLAQYENVVITTSGYRLRRNRIRALERTLHDEPLLHRELTVREVPGHGYEVVLVAGEARVAPSGGITLTDTAVGQVEPPKERPHIAGGLITGTDTYVQAEDKEFKPGYVAVIGATPMQADSQLYRLTVYGSAGLDRSHIPAVMGEGSLPVGANTNLGHTQDLAITSAVESAVMHMLPVYAFDGNFQGQQDVRVLAGDKAYHYHRFGQAADKALRQHVGTDRVVVVAYPDLPVEMFATDQDVIGIHFAGVTRPDQIFGLKQERQERIQGVTYLGSEREVSAWQQLTRSRQKTVMQQGQFGHSADQIDSPFYTITVAPMRVDGLRQGEQQLSSEQARLLREAQSQQRHRQAEIYAGEIAIESLTRPEDLLLAVDVRIGGLTGGMNPAETLQTADEAIFGTQGIQQTAREQATRDHVSVNAAVRNLITQRIEGLILQRVLRDVRVDEPTRARAELYVLTQLYTERVGRSPIQSDDLRPALQEARALSGAEAIAAETDVIRDAILGISLIQGVDATTQLIGSRTEEIALRLSAVEGLRRQLNGFDARVRRDGIESELQEATVLLTETVRRTTTDNFALIERLIQSIEPATPDDAFSVGFAMRRTLGERPVDADRDAAKARWMSYAHIVGLNEETARTFAKDWGSRF